MASSRKIRQFSFSDFLIYLFLFLFTAITIYPFLNVVATSFSPFSAYLEHPLMIFPHEFTIDTYVMIFRTGNIPRAFLNSVTITVCHTALGIFLTLLTAYTLAHKGLRGRKIFMVYILITMIFNGGMIPNFILIRSLGMYDSLLSLIIPGCLGAWSIFIMQNFIANIPDSLRESAMLDGASELRILWSIIIPLIGPAVAYLCLNMAVGTWNSFFNAMIYLREREKWPLQLYLRDILLAGNAAMNSQDAASETDVYFSYFNIKTANIVITILPIICIYPFLQKYFVKGVVIGAVKG